MYWTNLDSRNLFVGEFLKLRPSHRAHVRERRRSDGARRCSMGMQHEGRPLEIKLDYDVIYRPSSRTLPRNCRQRPLEPAPQLTYNVQSEFASRSTRIRVRSTRTRVHRRGRLDRLSRHARKPAKARHCRLTQAAASFRLCHIAPLGKHNGVLNGSGAYFYTG